MAMSNKIKFAICAMAMGVGLQFAPPSEAIVPACVKRCAFDRDWCLRSGGGASCFEEYNMCLADCG